MGQTSWSQGTPARHSKGPQGSEQDRPVTNHNHNPTPSCARRLTHRGLSQVNGNKASSFPEPAKTPREEVTVCALWEQLKDNTGPARSRESRNIGQIPAGKADSPRTLIFRCQGQGGGLGGRTGKPLLEKPGGQAIGHTQVIQALSRPLIQFEEQGRQVLPGSDDFFQQADGLENTKERTVHPAEGKEGQRPSRAPPSHQALE